MAVEFFMLPLIVVGNERFPKYTDGSLIAPATVTITRSGAVATVAHTAHDLSIGEKMFINGADDAAYNGLKTLTAITTNTYDYAVSGTPATPATGTITSTHVIERMGQIRYGHTSVAVTLVKTSQVYLNQIQSQSDAEFLCIETEMGDALGGPRRNAVDSYLEANGIPGNWIKTPDTWQDTLRGIIHIFFFAQRYEGLFTNALIDDATANSVGLNTQWQNIPTGFQDNLNAVAADHGFPTPIGSGTDLVRNILKDMADLFQNKPAVIANFTI